MDYGGQNLEYFLRNQSERLTEGTARLIARQVADALNYCHSIDIVHRDLKADNILIDDEMRIKLIDFGFAAIVPPGHKFSVFCGTPNYMAPEVVRKIPYDGRGSDVWAFGILLFKLLTREFPFHHANEKELYQIIASTRVKVPDYLSPHAADLIRKLLNPSVKERISADQISMHPWFHIV
jgi:MAP/microtubule affinity-regulating kinase